MKNRLFQNWTGIRMLYLLMGILIVVQSAMMREWMGVLMGGYFASMGLFSFGCASGQCFTTIEPKSPGEGNALEKIEYTEIK